MFNPFDHPIVYSTPSRLADSTWLSHIPFAMYLVDILRPRIIVELGSYAGVSYCAFCQAVQELHTETKCFAIDTWVGDPQSGHYGAEVLTDLRSHHDPMYGSFSTLLQSNFDDAISSFQHGSIDLLHIDGYHTYEAVAHDFETWLPNMSDRGVVLFHDTNIHEPTYGVWRFWAEQKQNYPHFEMLHGCGLGVLAVGHHARLRLTELIDATSEEQTLIARFFESVGKRWELEQESRAQQLRLRMQNQAIEWLQGEQTEYQQLQKLLPIRLLRAWTRYGTTRTLAKGTAKITKSLSGTKG
jgi:hypothetical protein